MPPDAAKGNIPLLHICFPSDSVSVRQTLNKVTLFLQENNVGSDQSGMIEIALAEVLNNIVEHGYRNTPSGEISMVIEQDAVNLIFHVFDEGDAMPPETLQNASAGAMHIDPQNLPEGGFGWYLIRQLTDDIQYQRHAGRNNLSFCIKKTT